MIVDHACGETAALEQHVLRLEELLIGGGDAEEIFDGQLIRILTLDLDGDHRAVQRLGEVAGEERSHHHDDEDRQSDLPPFVNDVPVVGEVDFLACCVGVEIHG